MILRRFMKHVTDQNWFAVGLDVIVVITGIFLGMQVTEWKEDQEDRVEEQRLLVRLLDDVRNNIRLAETRHAFFSAMEQDAKLVIAYLDDPDPDRVSPNRLLAALYNVSHFSPGNIDDTTYGEMSSSGKIGLIQDPDLRDAIATHYHAGYGWSRMWNMPRQGPVRSHVRGTIPIEIQTAISDDCEQVGNAYLNTLDEGCVWDGDLETASRLVIELTAQPAFKKNLTNRLATMRLIKIVVNLYLENSRELAPKLAAKIENPH